MKGRSANRADLVEQLSGLTDTELADYCTHILATKHMPAENMDALAERMLAVTDRTWALPREFTPSEQEAGGQPTRG